MNIPVEPTIELTPTEAALIRDAFHDRDYPFVEQVEPVVERIGKEADEFFVAAKKALNEQRGREEAEERARVEAGTDPA